MVALVGIFALAAMLVAGFIYGPRDWRGARPVLSSYVVILMGFTMYIALPAVLILRSGTYTWAARYYSEEQFAYAVWLCVIALISFILGNAISRQRHRSRSHRDDPSEPEPDYVNPPSNRTTNLLLFSLLGLGLGLKIALIFTTGGLESSLTRLSGYARAYTGVGALDAGDILLRTVSGVADGAAAWGVIRALRNRHREKTWLFLLFVTLALSYLTIGKRLVLILPLVCVLVAIHVYRRPLTTRLLPIVLAVAIVVGFATLSARVFLPASVVGYAVDLNDVAQAEGSVLQYYLYSLEFASLEMISVVMQSRSDILGLFGGVWDATVVTNFESFLYGVPRALFPGKPDSFLDLSYGVSAILGATPFEDPTVGYASTIVGTTYLLGGVIGVIVAMLVLGFATARIDRRLARGGWTDVSVVMYAIGLVVIFHLFRQGTLGWTFIVSIVQQYGAIAALLALSVASTRVIRIPDAMARRTLTR
jgi:hypothetical protein